MDFLFKKDPTKCCLQETHFIFLSFHCHLIEKEYKPYYKIYFTLFLQWKFTNCVKLKGVEKQIPSGAQTWKPESSRKNLDKCIYILGVEKIFQKNVNSEATTMKKTEKSVYIKIKTYVSPKK